MLVSSFFAFLLGGNLSPVFATESTATLPHEEWSFQGPTGTFNRTDLQHGFQIYKQVCSACHGLKHIRFMDLSALGFTPAEIKALAAEYKIPTINDEGEPVEQTCASQRHIPGPYKNEKAARASNNGALPPDLSLITKARVGGADYIYALLTGYESIPPKDVQLPEGMHYNPYFPGGQIAMIPPLSDGLETYSDGSKPSVNQMAKDVVTFLAWAAEPEMESREENGLQALNLFYSFYNYNVHG